MAGMAPQLSDEELARQLQQEERRSSGRAASASSARRKPPMPSASQTGGLNSLWEFTVAAAPSVLSCHFSALSQSKSTDRRAA
eukprot:COSAG02_NODE_1755_length_11052_cov_67.877842_10_plen_83_part_00